MAYREAQVAAGLPFPRKQLGAFTGVAILVAAAVFRLPIPFCATPDDEMDAVVAAIVAAQTDAHGRPSWLTRVVVRPFDGAW